MVPDDDPGWPFRKELLLGLVPGIGRVLMRRRWTDRTNGLVVLRQIFMTFCLGLIMLGVVLAVLWPSQSTQPAEPGFAIAMLLLGMIAGIAGRFVERPLQCTDDRTLSLSYGSRFFVRIAFAETAALFGFVGFFVASVWWVYPGGVAIASVGFARAAPTRRNLLRDQDRLTEKACSLRLVPALTGPSGS